MRGVRRISGPSRRRFRRAQPKPDWGLKRPGVDSAGYPVELSFVDYGRGNPVVLIHGWPLCKESVTAARRPLTKTQSPPNGIPAGRLSSLYLARSYPSNGERCPRCLRIVGFDTGCL